MLGGSGAENAAARTGPPGDPGHAGDQQQQQQPQQQPQQQQQQQQQRHDQLTPLLRIETEKDFQQSFKEKRNASSRFWLGRRRPAAGAGAAAEQEKHKRSATHHLGVEVFAEGGAMPTGSVNPVREPAADGAAEACMDKEDEFFDGHENGGGGGSPGRTGRFLKKHAVATAPALVWLPRYDVRKNLVRDVLIGVTLGFVIAPKAMAHALLAELSPIHGIYTAFFSTLVYGFMGNSKWLSLGTCALPALLFGEGLLATGFTDQQTLDELAPMLTFYIGMWTFVMLVLRLDKLVVLIPPAVLAAFTTTAAFLIGTSQVKYLFGVHIEASGFVQTYVALFKHIGETNPATVVLSIFNIALLVASKKATARWGRKRGIPDAGAMLAVLVSVGLVAAFDLDSVYDIEVAGPTPSGMPPFNVPWRYISDSSIHMNFLLEGMIIAIINFVLAIAIAKSFARKSNSVVKVSQELKALGAVNTIGSFFGAQVAGGSFSGSAIIASLQADTLLHNFVNSFVMMLILVVLTPMIELLPKATLAAIIVVALPSLIDFQKPIALARVKTDDFFLWVLTFVITLFAGVQWGIICGAALALMVLIRRNMGHDCPELGVLPGTNIYRSLDRFPDARRLPGIRMFRLDASLSFANFERFEGELETAVLRMVADRARHETPADFDSNSSGSGSGSGSGATSSLPSTFILSCEAVNDLDTAALEMLCRFASLCEANDILLLFSGWKSGERQTLYAAAEEYKRNHEPRADAAQLPGRLDEAGAKAEDLTPAAPGMPSAANSSLSLSCEIAGADADVENQLGEGSSHQGSLVDDAHDIAEEGGIAFPAPLDPKKWFLNLHDAVVRSQGLELRESCVRETLVPAPSTSMEDVPSAALTGEGAQEVGASAGAHQCPCTCQRSTFEIGVGTGALGESDDARAAWSPSASWGLAEEDPTETRTRRRASDLIVVKKRTHSTPVTMTTELGPGGKTHFHTYAQRSPPL